MISKVFTGLLGTGQCSQDSNPQSSSARSQVEDRDGFSMWGGGKKGVSCYSTERLTVDHSG